MLYFGTGEFTGQSALNCREIVNAFATSAEGCPPTEKEISGQPSHRRAFEARPFLGVCGHHPTRCRVWPTRRTSAVSEARNVVPVYCDVNNPRSTKR
jgi:hypothetical protein